MADKQATQPIKIAPPGFYVPEGTANVVRDIPTTDEVISQTNEVDDTTDSTEDISADDSDDAVDFDLMVTDAPGVPAINGVISQTIRYLPDGTARVDVVLDIEDTSPVGEYDVRISK